MNDSVEPDTNRPSQFRRAFLKYQLKLQAEGSLRVLRRYMNPDFSVDSLEAFDRQVLARTPEEFKKRTAALDPRTSSMWVWYVGPGSYFAEVIIRNLGGQWKYPSRILVFFCIWAGYISPVYHHWYVTVGKQKVPVFEIMKRRLEMGANQVSLVRIYSEIKNGTYDHKKWTVND